MVAVTLLVSAALLVLGAVISGSSLVTTIAALGGVALGAAATKITHAELLQTRRDWARDRAQQAQAYADLSERRTKEHTEVLATLQARIAAKESAIGELEVAVTEAQGRAAQLARKMSAEARRADLAEGEATEIRARLEEADQRAAEAIVRLAELELEQQALKAELDVWTSTPVRKHA